MSLGVFDIGGTTVKHGIWEHQQLSPVNAFPTPVTFDELLRNMAEIIRDAKRPLTGIAISAPGAVDQEAENTRHQRRALHPSTADL